MRSRSLLRHRSCFAPVQAFGAKSAIEQKKAQEKATVSQLEAARQELALRVADYVEISQQLDRVRQQVEQVSGDITQADARLQAAQMLSRSAPSSSTAAAEPACSRSCSARTRSRS